MEHRKAYLTPEGIYLRDYFMNTTRKTLSNKLDKLFSLKVREIGYCQKEGCGKTDGLQCAHIYSRKNKWLRWNLENAVCLCSGHHMFWAHLEPAEFIRWCMKIKNFDYLDKLRQINRPMKEFDMQEIYDRLKVS